MGSRCRPCLARGGYEPAPGDRLTRRASSVFFGGLARLRIIRCGVDPATGRQRVAGRPRRLAHPDASLIADADYYSSFAPLSLDLEPTIDVDTTDGYEPSLGRIVAFVMAEAQGSCPGPPGTGL